MREVDSTEEENWKQREGKWSAMLVCSERKQQKKKTDSNGNRRQGSDYELLPQVTKYPAYLAIPFGMSMGTHTLSADYAQAHVFCQGCGYNCCNIAITLKTPD
jgi:hypothetical protein